MFWKKKQIKKEELTLKTKKEGKKLRDFLDEQKIYEGDERTFVLKVGLFKPVEVIISRKDIETTDSYKYILDKVLLAAEPGYINVHGQKTVLLIVEED